jgi:hypothetical protein
MDGVLDAITAIFGRAAVSWLGMLALASPIWLLGAVRARQALQRIAMTSAVRSAEAFALRRNRL